MFHLEQKNKICQKKQPKSKKYKGNIFIITAATFIAAVAVLGLTLYKNVK